MEASQIELITKMVMEAMAKQECSDGYMVPVGVSARHVHLTQEHVEALFGPGYQLTKKKELMGGQFAANEQVTIVGLKLRAIENVRVLGPVRKASQVEISSTDAMKLGVKAPLRESGDTAGSAPIAIVGPKGAVYLNEGCIVAKRHIHMSPLMEEILSFCSEKAELGIITNGPSAHQWNKVKSLQAERWIPHGSIFVSADVGAEKPERKIFDCAKQAMGLEDTEIWFVGDAYALDVVGALNAGWNAVWMNRRRRQKPEDAVKTGPGRVVCVETEEELDGFIRELLE